MNVVLWVVSGILAAVFLGAGLLKSTQPKEKVMEAQGERMGWMNDFTASQVRLIGLAEVVGAVGLVVPELTGVAPVLTPIAAACLGLLMLGAAQVHRRRGERDGALVPLVLALLSLFVAVARFAG